MAFQLIPCADGGGHFLSVKPRDTAVRLGKGLFVCMDLPVDVQGELLKDRALSTQRVPREETIC